MSSGPPLPDDLDSYPKAFARMGERVNALLRFCRAVSNIQGRGGIDCTLTDNNLLIDGTELEQEIANGGGGGGASALAHPFRVELVTGNLVAINAASRLYTALSPAAPLSISDLTTQIALGSSTKVWLKGTVNSSLATTAANITTTDPANLITIAGSPAAQTEWHLLIGKVTSGTSTAPGFDFQLGGVDYHFEQTCFSHLLVENRCNANTPVVYPFPFTGA